MGKGPYEDIPEENMVFNYNSSRNISFHGSFDSGYTIEEWNQMTEEQQSEVEMDLFWSSDIVEFWISEDAEANPW